jgi:Protein of unknown function, DUF481
MRYLPAMPWLVAALVLGAPLRATALADKTDVVELTNGDRITCEIKKLDRGKLTVKTDGIGTVAIEWDDIDRLTSAARFDLELESGEHHYGMLVRGADARTVDVVDGQVKVHLALGDIVRLAAVGGSFWARLDGSIAAGFNFASANDQTQWTFNSSVAYRSRLWSSQLTGDSLLTVSDDTDRQTRNSLGLQSLRYLHPRWFGVGFMQFQQNEELSLQLRSVAGGGVGRSLAQSNRQLSWLAAGAAYTNEQYVGEPGQSVAEAVVGASYAWFTFDGRSTNLTTTAYTFYALTGGARMRLELNTSFKSDIVGDLYWSVNLYESFNSRPPAGEKENDFSISASLGWTF